MATEALRSNAENERRGTAQRRRLRCSAEECGKARAVRAGLRSQRRTLFCSDIFGDSEDPEDAPGQLQEDRRGPRRQVEELCQTLVAVLWRPESICLDFLWAEPEPDRECLQGHAREHWGGETIRQQRLLCSVEEEAEGRSMQQADVEKRRPLEDGKRGRC
ncbi:hypothetical protein ERJ75_000293800 [Trypanosoma vivax]|nr:hypothetical protein ERJ75_000293800 [Trypanosoma vivax]